MSDWWIYKGTKEPHDGIEKLPEAPSWRKFDGSDDVSWRTNRRRGLVARGAKFLVDDEEKDLINAALLLRRPLFVMGKPGCGKSSLAYAVAYELKLGPVLRWSITTRVMLQDGLYHYDAIGRLQDASMAKEKNAAEPEIGQYIRLGPLGTALLPRSRPRVLLIDEIDKGDIDLPNDLLNIFEEGEYDIPELARLGRLSKMDQRIPVMPYDGVKEEDQVYIEGGKVRCEAFPFIVLTSNGERQFPPAFLRRCIQLEMRPPNEEKLTAIVREHLGEDVFPQAERLVKNFLARRREGDLATDQLLNAIYLTTQSHVDLDGKEKLVKALFKYLNTEAL